MTAVEAIAPQKERSEKNEVGEDDSETIKIQSLRKPSTFLGSKYQLFWPTFDGPAFQTWAAKDNRREIVLDVTIMAATI